MRLANNRPHAATFRRDIAGHPVEAGFSGITRRCAVHVAGVRRDSSWHSVTTAASGSPDGHPLFFVLRGVFFEHIRLGLDGRLIYEGWRTATHFNA